MDKVMWGSSQAITSTLYFAIQLTFLKSSNLSQMALFLTLFGLMNFLLLAIRRSLIEVNRFDFESPAISISIIFTCLYFVFCVPISFLIHKDVFIVFCVSLFLFDQLVLDFVRFSDNKNHFVFIVIQWISLIASIVLMFIDISATNTFLFLAILQFVFCLICIFRDRRRFLGFSSSLKQMNASRAIDFVISSGFGFLLPILTFLFLDAKSVGELRTSQNLLSLGSIFASAYYYSTLKSDTEKEEHKLAYYLPSVLLLVLLTFLTFFISPPLLKQLLGPYFFDSLPLTFLLIIALVPTIRVFKMNALLIKTKNFKSLLKVHLISLVFLAFGTCLGFLFIGIISFGLFSIFAAMLEMFLIRKLLERGSNDFKATT